MGIRLIVLKAEIMYKEISVMLVYLFSIAIIIGFVIGCFNRLKYKKIRFLIIQREYKEALYLATKVNKLLLYSFAKDPVKFDIAVLNLALGNGEEFLSVMQSVKYSKLQMVKYFWITFFYILCEDNEKANEYYQVFSSENIKSLNTLKGAGSYETYDRILQSLFNYDSTNDESKNILIKLESELKNPILKHQINIFMNVE